MRLFILGGEGRVGTFTIPSLARRWAVTAPTLAELDARDREALFRAVETAEPDLVVNYAALTDLHQCEREPELARQVNAVVAGNAAAAARRVGARLLYLSTDAVFDGVKGTPYTETDAPNPVNVYGRTKREGELEVEDKADDWTILRIGWLFGGTQVGKFPDFIIKLARERDRLQVVDDRYGSPMRMADLLEILLGVVPLKELRGYVHVANPGPPPNRLEFAREILAANDLAQVELEGVSSDHFGEKVPRGPYLGLNIDRLRSLKLEPTDDWTAAVRAEYRR
ncbi:MAG: sugar nucleotide-binding protein [Candidatus Coatesbacteria bacterium]|nr:sugar nucleotide-binding protein [Candidatus Coatesbacteria bacterium]